MLAKLQLALICLVALATPTLAEQTYSSYQLERAERQVFDQLKNPWYKVELILFERLQVLPFNTEEELISTAPWQIPAGISELAEPGALTLSDSWQPDLEWCRGYPMLPNRLYTHPTTGAAMAPPMPPDYQISDETSPHEESLGNDTANFQELTAEPLVAEPTTPADDFAKQLAAFEQTLVDQSLLALDGLTLETEVKLINRRRHLRPLLHLGWLQVPASREVLAPIEIAVPENLPRVFGNIGLSLGRYLHFAVDLRYQVPAGAWRPLPASAQAMAIDPDVGYIHFRESRRMRSGELHYLDHPKLGVIVRVDPIKIPEPLILQWLSLRNP